MELSEIIEIIKCNPNKGNIDFGKAMNARLETCILGCNLDTLLKRNDYFENKSINQERKKTTSNKDLIGRLTQKEGMVFSSRGGSLLFSGIDSKKQSDLNDRISKVRIGISLRSWIKEFANKAYEVDPMGLIFIEKDEEGNPYPTYKSIKSVYDYSGSGRSLDYVCFQLTNNEAYKFDIPDEQLEKLSHSTSKTSPSKYFRFVDETNDYIFKKDNNEVTLVELKEDGTSMTIEHQFGSCPSFIVSDIPNFTNNSQYISKFDNIIELAECYQQDRSIRDLTKKFHGFPKLVQPIVKCGKCVEGYIGNTVCPDCSGTGRKKISNISDTIDIPLEMLSENTSLDIKKIFVYITPPIETWNKQDNSLSDLENLISDVFWGTDNRKFTQGTTLKSDNQETATKTMTNLQPIYARLERTAEWAENTEKTIIDFMGKVLYSKDFESSVKYGRDYILESTDSIYQQYLDYKKKGSPQYILNDYLDRYLRSLYQNNPIELSIALKLMEVEPFVHYSVVECIGINIPSETLKTKVYFSEWYNSVTNDYLIASTVAKMKADLLKYVSDKQLVEPTTTTPVVKDLNLKS